MCGGNDGPEPIRTPAPPRTLEQESPDAPKRESGSDLKSATTRAAEGTKKYKTEGDLSINGSPTTKSPTGVKL